MREQLAQWVDSYHPWCSMSQTEPRGSLNAVLGRFHLPFYLYHVEVGLVLLPLEKWITCTAAEAIASSLEDSPQRQRTGGKWVKGSPGTHLTFRKYRD